MSNKLDPRVVRTLRMLRDALVSLILKQGYDTITIQDIADEAGLRRATFYLHYRDKEELLMATLREMVDELAQKLEALPCNVLTPEAEYDLHLLMFRHVQEHVALYRAIMNGQGAKLLVGCLRDYVAHKTREKFVAELDESQFPIPIDLLANYLAALKLNMALWWVEQGMPYTPERMATMCAHLTLNGALAALPGEMTLASV